MAAASSAPSTPSSSRLLGKMIADKFLEKLATIESVPIDHICNITPYKKSNNAVVKEHYYIVNEEGFNYTIYDGANAKSYKSIIQYRIIVNDISYGKFIYHYLHFISYTTDEPFELIIKTLKVPVLNAAQLDQYADTINEIYEHIDSLTCCYDNFDNEESDD